MTSIVSSVRRFGARFKASERGAAAVTIALLLTSIISSAGFVIDVGHVLYVKRALQAATDASALAGAHDIYAGGAATTATNYSAVAGKKNAIPGVTVTLLSGYPQLKCLSPTGVSCGGPSTANAIVVKQQASVPMWFAQIVGINAMTINATSTAGATGGSPKSLDIMLVLDTTASMNSADSSCSISGATRLTCAEAGARTLLNSLQPTGDQVGLMVFPGVQSSTASKEYDCSSTNPTVVSYKSSPTYSILGLGNDFKSSNTSTSLSASSNMVKAVGGGASGCTGMAAVGGVGTYFADAVTAAQSSLTSTGRANVQKVMIILSDGDAGATSSNMTTGAYHNQCQEAINAASAATSAGTWVYTVGYGAPTSSTGSCSTDSPHISACSTLQQMASQASFFYSDQTGGSSTCTSSANSTSELVSIFQNIGSSFGSPRLLPDTTN